MLKICRVPVLHSPQDHQAAMKEQISLRQQFEHFSAVALVTPRARGYEDVTVTYIRRAEIPSHIYAKH